MTSGIDWDGVCEAIRSVFEPLIGLDTGWRDQRNGFVRPSDAPSLGGGGECKLHSEVLNELGWSDFRQKFNPDTDKIDLTQTGYFKFVVSVLVESYDPSNPKTAVAYLSGLEIALNRPQIIARLLAFNLSVAGFSDTRDHPTIMDEHVVSAASADLEFLAVFTEVADGDGVDQGLAPLDYIRTVGAAGYNGEDPDAPFVMSVTPSSGAPGGGTVLVLKGRKFTDANGADVDGVPCGSFAVIDDNTIHCTSPIHAVGERLSINVSTPSHGKNWPNSLFTVA